MAEEQDEKYEEAKRAFTELAVGLQQHLPAVQCANIFTGAAIALLKSAGGDAMAIRYFEEIADDLKLDAAGYFGGDETSEQVG